MEVTTEIVWVAIAVVALIAYVVRDGMARLNGGKDVQRRGGGSNIIRRNATANVEDWLLGNKYMDRVMIWNTNLGSRV